MSGVGRIPNILSVAGSDPSGGAGIQADLKTFAASGVYGMAVITALTAQNTLGVSAVEPVRPDFVGAQIDAIFADIRVDAVKIGLVATAAIALAIADALDRHRPPVVVLDPVMVATSGSRLLTEDAVAALRERLLPFADVVTPNLPEAAALLGEDTPCARRAMPEVAERLRRMGPRAVLLKGGHLAGADSPDYLATRTGGVWLEGTRLATSNTHGTGCTLSSALAARLALGGDVVSAARGAKDYVAGTIAASGQLDVGVGNGPVHHCHALWLSQ